MHPQPRAVLLVEGHSDRNAVETLARRRGRRLAEEGVAVVALGGVTNIRPHLHRYGGDGLRLAGLYDAGEERYVSRSLEWAGLGTDLSRSDMADLGFHVCDADLEDELIRSLGVPAVERVVAGRGELDSFRRMQRQPAQRDRATVDQLRRFIAGRSGHKLVYAGLLVEALDLDNVPPPLDGVLRNV